MCREAAAVYVCCNGATMPTTSSDAVFVVRFLRGASVFYVCLLARRWRGGGGRAAAVCMCVFVSVGV